MSDGVAIRLRTVITPATLSVMTERVRRLAVVCSDGCGFRSRRLYPADPKPCPKCGHPVDVGIPYKEARQNANGSLGGRIELHWSRWE